VDYFDISRLEVERKKQSKEETGRDIAVYAWETK
jgi:hypothetical protein